MRQRGSNAISVVVFAACLIGGPTAGAMDPPEVGTTGPEWTNPGAVIWKRQFGTSKSDGASAVATDAANNVLIVGKTNGDPYVADAFVAKYSPLGKLLWTSQLADSGASGVATDAKGNVLISGSTQGRAFVAKYSPGGSLVWTRQLADSGAGGVATDAKGNVIISGSKWGSLGGALIGQIDAFVAKFSPSGNLLWAQTYGFAGVEYDITYGSGVAADADGNVLLTGTTVWNCFRCSEPRNAFIAKYTASGHLLWTRELTAANWGSGPVATSVAADHRHNVVIVGYTWASLGAPMISGQDAFIAKYSAWGKLLWTRNFNPGGPEGIAAAQGVVTDGLGNILVASTTCAWYDLCFPIDAFVAKYRGSGSLLWMRPLGTSHPDGAAGIAIDSAGNVLVAGATEGSLGGPNQGGSDAFVAKLRP